ncbi:MAG: YceI family protein [Deltaproteobacteria bacterium]|nr:YceI family protein [Deltaproteobacteria bacterium]
MKKIIFLILLFIVVWPLQAAAQQWKIDYAHTNIYFDVRHTYVPVRGQFMDFTGDVYFDPDNPGKSRFDFVIKVDSVDTKIGKRDTHLRSPDFFDTGKYPVMTFKSSKVSHGGDNKYIVEGTLTIKDVSRKLILEFVYHGQKDNPVKPGEIVAGLETGLTIDRLAYNVGDGKFYKLGVVDKDVNILFVLELLRDK